MIAGLDQRLAARVGGRAAFAASFSARTMRSLEDRADRELADAVSSAEAGLAAIDKAAARLDAGDRIDELKGQWLDRFVDKWAAYQHAGARTLNWMVTGPARFPVDRNRKRMDTEHKRLGEMLEHVKGAGAWAEKQLKRAIAAELGPVGLADRELEQARANLAARVDRQAMMKAANAAVRKARKVEDADAARQLVERELEAAGRVEAKTLANALYKGGALRVGFESWQLSNNNAEIRRLEGRVAELERKAARMAEADAADAEPDVVEQAGVQLVRNVAIDRVQLLFPDKPSAEARAVLKGRGFRWSPREGAWQRQLTGNGIAAAEALLRQLAA